MDIHGFPGYKIYEDGRVWSNKIGKGRWLRPGIMSTGYPIITLRKDGKSHSHLVHRLMGEHFIPNPDSKPQIDHIDRDKTNNHISNLRWVTRVENMDNRGMYNNNTSGHENISYFKRDNKWQFQKRRNKVNIHKFFDTLEEAIEFKKKFV